MQTIKKNTVLFLILLYLLYCALSIGGMWDSTAHLEMGKNKLKFFFSLGQIEHKGSWYDSYQPGISYTITAFFTNILPKKYQFELLHIVNLIVSLSAVYGITKISRILFDKKVSNIVFLTFLFYPTFFGHMAINPKDTVFTVCFVWITYYVLKYLTSNKKYQNNNIYILKISFLLAVGSGIRLGFASILIPIIIFAILEVFYFKKMITKSFSIKFFIFDLIKIIFISFFILILFWPQAYSNILIEPFKLFFESLSAPWGVASGMLNGKIYLTNQTPKNYIILNFILKSPEYLLFLYILSIYFIFRYNSFFKEKFNNFNYKLYFIILVLFFSNLLFIFSPFPLYDGMRLFMYLISFFILIPSLGIYFLISKSNFLYFKICLILTTFLIIVFLYKFISLTPYHYVYLNYLNGKTSNNYQKFENDYLSTSIKELVNKSKFLNKKTKLTFCGASSGIIKRYLNKYNYSKVRLVRPEEKYDYVLATNRVDWNSVGKTSKSTTCFQTFEGETLSKVERNGLILSVIKKTN